MSSLRGIRNREPVGGVPFVLAILLPALVGIVVSPAAYSALSMSGIPSAVLPYSLWVFACFVLLWRLGRLLVGRRRSLVGVSGSRVAALWAVLCAFALLFGIVYANLRAPNDFLPTGIYQFEGTIVDRTPTAATIRIGNAKGLLYSKDSALVVGAKATVTARVYAPVGSPLVAFDTEAYMQRMRLAFVAGGVKVDTVARPCGVSLPILIARLRKSATAAFVSAGVSPEYVPFIRAILLGDRTGLSAVWKDNFSRCGTYHILALSGLHVGIIYGLLLFLARGAGLGRKRRVLAAVVVLVWFYAFVTGFGDSVVRAALMFTFFTLFKSWHSYRRGNHALALALFAQILIDPLSVYSLGLWLSYLSVFALINLSGTMAAVVGWLRSRVPAFYGLRTVVCRAAQLLFASLVAQMATLALQMLINPNLPLFFWLNNVVLLPVMPVLMLACVALLALGPVGWLVGGVVDALCRFIDAYSVWAAGLPQLRLNTSGYTVVEVVLLCVLMMSVVLAVSRRYTRICRVFVCAAFVAALAFCVVFGALNREAVADNKVVLWAGARGVNASVRMKGALTHFLTDSCDAGDLRRAEALSAHTRSSGQSVRSSERIDALVAGRLRVAFSVGAAECAAGDSVGRVILALPDSYGYSDWEKRVAGVDSLPVFVTARSTLGLMLSEDVREKHILRRNETFTVAVP